MAGRSTAWGLGLWAVALVATAGSGQGPSGGINNPPAATAPASRGGDLELVEKLLVARREYQKALEALRAHYVQVGDVERAKWAEDELKQYHRILKPVYRLELDVPPPTLTGNVNVPEANKLFTRALEYKDKGWGTEYIDNQRRAEILLQELLTKYPQSNKIDEAAYALGELYESKAFKQPRRAAQYYERCFQWNPRTTKDARLRAARIYDRELRDRTRAIELYREITTHETDPRRLQEANRRLAELSGGR
ncbi:MAG: hypothetical protein NZO58_01395 [Gemmataceae bacterium]|nr:hypothetical protein [Gemmataceae bacterium]